MPEESDGVPSQRKKMQPDQRVPLATLLSNLDQLKASGRLLAATNPRKLHSADDSRNAIRQVAKAGLARLHAEKLARPPR